MNMRRHYLLKLGKGNSLFDFFDKKRIDQHVIIGHGSWKVLDYPGNYLNCGTDQKDKDFIKRSKKQIEDFFDHREDKKNSFFWLFHNSKIYALQPDSDIYDLEEYLKQNINKKFTEYCCSEDDWTDYKKREKIDNNKFHLWADAKLFKAKKVLELESSSVIHNFASTNANRYYNSKTIVKLQKDSLLYDIADSIIKIKLLKGNHKAVPNDIEEKLKYLSPTQFETLVFLTLYEMGYLPSTYRGGSGKDHDIFLYDADKNLSKKLEGKKYISVKLNSSQTNYPLTDEEKSVYVFGVSDTKSSNKNSINIMELMNDLKEKERDRINSWIGCQISNLLPFSR